MLGSVLLTAAGLLLLHRCCSALPEGGFVRVQGTRFVTEGCDDFVFAGANVWGLMEAVAGGASGAFSTPLLCPALNRRRGLENPSEASFRHIFTCIVSFCTIITPDAVVKSPNRVQHALRASRSAVKRPSTAAHPRPTALSLQ